MLAFKSGAQVVFLNELTDGGRKSREVVSLNKFKNQQQDRLSNMMKV